MCWSPSRLPSRDLCSVFGGQSYPLLARLFAWPSLCVCAFVSMVCSMLTWSYSYNKRIMRLQQRTPSYLTGDHAFELNILYMNHTQRERERKKDYALHYYSSLLHSQNTFKTHTKSPIRNFHARVAHVAHGHGQTFNYNKHKHTQRWHRNAKGILQ